MLWLMYVRVASELCPVMGCFAIRGIRHSQGGGACPGAARRPSDCPIAGCQWPRHSGFGRLLPTAMLTILAPKQSVGQTTMDGHE
jgi:hypothetical protein